MGLTIQFLLKLAMVGPVVQDGNSETTRICILIQVSMYSHLINFLSFIQIAVARVELKVLLLPLGLHSFFMVCLPFRPVLQSFVTKCANGVFCTAQHGLQLVRRLKVRQKLEQKDTMLAPL